MTLARLTPAGRAEAATDAECFRRLAIRMSVTRRPFPDRSRMATAILEKPVSDRGKGARRQDTWRKRSRQTRSSARSPCRTSTAAADPRGLAAAHEPRRSAETQGPANRRASDWPISIPPWPTTVEDGVAARASGVEAIAARGEGSTPPFPARGFGDGKPLGHGLLDADSLYPRRTQDGCDHRRTHQAGVSRQTGPAASEAGGDSDVYR